MVVVSGGVSVGPHDHVKPALAALGVEERFWRVALRPGKPTWFGMRGGTLVFGLPGNPVSAMVTFLLFARPALRGAPGRRPRRPRASARLGERCPRNPAATQAVRVALDSGDDGVARRARPAPRARTCSRRCSGADALALIPRGDGELPPAPAACERI